MRTSIINKQVKNVCKWFFISSHLKFCNQVSDVKFLDTNNGNYQINKIPPPLIDLDKNLIILYDT